MELNPPSDYVLHAFGLAGPASHLPGREARCFTAGGAVLKRADDDDESQKVAEMVTSLLGKLSPASLYRLPRPMSAVKNAGTYIQGGWTASQYINGKEGPKDHFRDILRICKALHDDLSSISSQPPAFIGKRTNRWSQADCVTWGEMDVNQVPGINHEILAHLASPLEQLKQMKRELPIIPAEQLIHADLTGNVLFSQDGELPTVIDITLYWRPAEYAGAVIVADGLTWFGEGQGLVEAYGTDELHLQYLVRALFWRCLTFAIDHDPQWIRDTVPIEGFLGANRVVKEVMHDMEQAKEAT